MQEVIREYLNNSKTGERQSYKNLTMVPLISPDFAALDYLLLDETLAAGLIEVAEVSTGGSVPELKVVNKSEKMILLLDGEELVGAKQNRIINTTILIATKSTTVIPVSCVEQGRWSYRSDRFYSEERVMSSDLRAKKVAQVYASLKNRGNYMADQGAIWDEIEAKASRLKAQSPSMAMSGIYEKETSSLREYTGHFQSVEEQTGAIFLINGVIAGLDAFGKHHTFAKVFTKLLQSYALDALDWYKPDRKHTGKEGIESAFLQNILAARMEARPSVALGTDLRFQSEAVIGSALIMEGHLLHLTAFERDDRIASGRMDSRMERPSKRRREI